MDVVKALNKKSRARPRGSEEELKNGRAATCGEKEAGMDGQ